MTISLLNSLSYLEQSVTSNTQSEQIAGQEAAAFWQQLAAMRALAAAEEDDKQQREQAFGQQQSAQQQAPYPALGQTSGLPQSTAVFQGSEVDSLLSSSSTVSPSRTAAQSDSANTTHEDEHAQSAAAESLLNKLFEQLLANRLGIDQKRMDEIKQKLQDLEQLKQQLSQQAEQTPAVAKQLQQLDEQMLKLNDELATLVKQATERMKNRTEENAKARA